MISSNILSWAKDKDFQMAGDGLIGLWQGQLISLGAFREESIGIKHVIPGKETRAAMKAIGKELKLNVLRSNNFGTFFSVKESIFDKVDKVVSNLDSLLAAVKEFQRWPQPTDPHDLVLFKGLAHFNDDLPAAMAWDEGGLTRNQILKRFSLLVTLASTGSIAVSAIWFLFTHHAGLALASPAYLFLIFYLRWPIPAGLPMFSAMLLSALLGSCGVWLGIYLGYYCQSISKGVSPVLELGDWLLKSYAAQPWLFWVGMVACLSFSLFGLIKEKVVRPQPAPAELWHDLEKIRKAKLKTIVVFVGLVLVGVLLLSLFGPLTQGNPHISTFSTSNFLVLCFAAGLVWVAIVLIVKRVEFIRLAVSRRGVEKSLIRMEATIVVVVGYIFFLVFSCLFMDLMNSHLDKGPTTEVEVGVVKISRAGNQFLQVNHWSGINFKPAQLPKGAESRVRLWVRPGRLGMEWVERYQVQP